MKPIFIKCNLLKIEVQEKGYGTKFVLTNKETKEEYSIMVDESLERVLLRLKEQYNGNNEKKGIYLSRCMTNIDVNTNGNEWDINEEDWKYYGFDKKDVEKFIC